jgi:hypothetical protein
LIDSNDSASSSFEVTGADTGNGKLSIQLKNEPLEATLGLTSCKLSETSMLLPLTS